MNIVDPEYVSIFICSKCHSQSWITQTQKRTYIIPVDKYKEYVMDEFADVSRVFYIYSPLVHRRQEIIDFVIPYMTEEALIIDCDIYEKPDINCNYVALPQDLYGEWLCTRESSPVVDFVIQQIGIKFLGGALIHYAYLPSRKFSKDEYIKLLFDKTELEKEGADKALGEYKLITLGVNDGRP